MNRNNMPLARAAMKLVCTLLGVILVLMLGATAYVQALTGQLPLDPGPVLSMLGKGGEYVFQTGSSGPVLREDAVQPVNILLVGQDRREGESDTRSDTMILCSFNEKTKQLVLTSFLRDLYVPIPGYGSNRINAAYAFGGTELLKDTLESNFGVEIHGCVEVDFAQFSQIMDLLGGVQVELRADEAAVISRETGSEVSEGLQTLTGQQALAYARIRSLDADGDFSRTARQRRVLEAVWDAYKNSSLTSLIRTMGSLLPMIETDMGSGELLGLAVKVFPCIGELELVSQRIPADGQYRDQMIDGMSVLVADMEAARKNLEKAVYSGENQDNS